MKLHDSIADITAWVCIDQGSASAFEIPNELEHLSRWFAETSLRPSTRA